MAKTPFGRHRLSGHRGIRASEAAVWGAVVTSQQLRRRGQMASKRAIRRSGLFGRPPERVCRRREVAFQRLTRGLIGVAWRTGAAGSTTDTSPLRPPAQNRATLASSAPPQTPSPQARQGSALPYRAYRLPTPRPVRHTHTKECCCVQPPSGGQTTLWRRQARTEHAGPRPGDLDCASDWTQCSGPGG